MTDIQFDTIQAALAGPVSELFWLQHNADGTSSTGHSKSFYTDDRDDKYLLFDVSNNKVLANLAPSGEVMHFSVYRDSYAADPLAPGIWWYKDYTQTGPFGFHLQLGDEGIDLTKVDWPARMELLGGVLPMATLTGPTVEAKLLAFAPISADGTVRPRGLIYGLQLTNTSDQPITGKVIIPTHTSDLTHVAMLETDDHRTRETPFELAAGESLWMPTVITPVPARDTLAELDGKTSLQWQNETLSYFRRMTGELTMPGDPFAAEFFSRCVHQCFHGMAMNADGEFVGANWSGFPSTKQIWMKDLYHAAVPLAQHEPALLTQCILWFLDRSVRPWGDKDYEGFLLEGGVSFSITNSLIPVILSGMYYRATGDKTFFADHPEVVAKIRELLTAIHDCRKGEPWLFYSEWLSDGPSRSDYHTGSNLVTWYAFAAAADILQDVCDDAEQAGQYREIAGHIRADIDRLCIADGPAGPQYAEGAFADGSHELDHDGEETDTSLMPFYGYCRYDNPAHQNNVRVAMTTDNKWYRESTRGIKDSTWINDPTPAIDATYPGYMTGLAGVQTAAEMTGPDGMMTRIAERTDLDGSIWWWPFRAGEMCRAYEIDGGFVGKTGWASGVFAAHFVSQILGLNYHAPSRTLSWLPFSPASDFTWAGARLGSGLFDLQLARQDGKVAASVTNHCDCDVTVELELILAPGTAPKSITVNGKSFNGQTTSGAFFDSATVKLALPVEAGAGLEVIVEF